MANKFTISTTFKAHDRMTKVVKGMNKSMAGFSKTLRLLKVAVAGGIIFKGFQFFIKEASRIEDATAAFTPLMGGVEKANKLVDALNKTAATTPFQFENISKAAMQLLPVMNQDIEKTIGTFRMLGDTAGGNAQKLDSITRGFTKSMLKGKVDMESLNMIAEAGVPIFSEMAKSMGISKEKLFDMSKAGKLTTNALIKTFQDMTKKGGIFFEGMEIASKTLSGKLSTLKDNIKLVAARIGNSLLPFLKPIIDKLTLIAVRVGDWFEANRLLINMRLSLFLKKLKDGFERLVPILQKVWKLFRDLWSIMKKVWDFVSKLTGAFAGGFLDAIEGIEEPLGGVFESLGKIFDLMSGGTGAVADLTKMFRGLGMIVGGTLVASLQMFNYLLSEAVYLMTAADIVAQTLKAWKVGDMATIAEKKVEITSLRQQQQRYRQQQDIAFRQFRENWGRKYNKMITPESGGASAGWGEPSAGGGGGRDILGAGASVGWGTGRIEVDVAITKVPAGVAAQVGVKSKSPNIDLPRGRAGASGQW